MGDPGIEVVRTLMKMKVFKKKVCFNNEPEYWTRIFFAEVKGEIEMIFCALLLHIIPAERAIAMSNEK